MTCRIERYGVGEGPVVLRVCGQITGQDVDLLRALLERETSAPVLDLHRHSSGGPRGRKTPGAQ
jgi:hypothetical protein